MFTLFPKLPTELRLVIWEMVLPGPRILESTFYFDLRKQLCWSLLPSENSPATLFTCRESREIGLKHYQPLTEEGMARPLVQYFHPANDTLFSTSISCDERGFECPDSDTLADPLTLVATRIPKVSKLAVYVFYQPDDYQSSLTDTNLLADFRSLQELIIVPPRPAWDIDNSSVIKAFGRGDSHGWNTKFEQFWKYDAPEYERMFAELEKSVAGWKAPELRTGIFMKEE
jgi:hypothetical protein